MTKEFDFTMQTEEILREHHRNIKMDLEKNGYITFENTLYGDDGKITRIGSRMDANAMNHNNWLLHSHIIRTVDSIKVRFAIFALVGMLLLLAMGVWRLMELG